MFTCSAVSNAGTGCHGMSLKFQTNKAMHHIGHGLVRDIIVKWAAATLMKSSDIKVSFPMCYIVKVGINARIGVHGLCRKEGKRDDRKD